MARSTKPAKFDAGGFVKGLESLLDTLPSESQKQEVNNAFTELIGFLRDLQNFFMAMPSTENVAQLRESLPILEEFNALAEKVPSIAESIGAGAGGSKKKGGGLKTEESDIDANEVLTTLKKLSTDEIRSQLGSKTYSKPDLLQIASELSLKLAQSATKPAIADKIANRIESQRLRDGLAGRFNGEPAVN